MDVFSLRLREESIGIWEIRVLEFGEKVNCVNYERRKFRVLRVNCGCLFVTRV